MSEQAMYEAIFEQMADLLFIMTSTPNHEFRYLKMNSAAMRVSGLNEYAYGATFDDVVVPEEADILQMHYQRAVLSRKPVSFILNHNGNIGESILTPLFGSDGRCQQVIGTVRDVTAQFEREEALKLQAHRDALTGLPNRYNLESNLQALFAEAGATGMLSTVFVVDVDHLKFVNDTFGHMVGDLFLQTISNRLQAAIREGDIVSRFGGDEFVIGANLSDELHAMAMAERLLQEFRVPWWHGEIHLDMSVSIGIAIRSMEGETVHQLVRSADEALYQAKRQGGNQYVIAPSTHAASGLWAWVGRQL